MIRRIASRKGERQTTVIVRLNTEEEVDLFQKEFQKMIKKCNHLLKNEIGYELIIVQSGRCSPRV